MTQLRNSLAWTLSKRKIVVGLTSCILVIYLFYNQKTCFTNLQIKSELNRSQCNGSNSQFELMAEVELSKYSAIVQDQINRLQAPENCPVNGSDYISLHCGASEVCGFGCQLHHRILCLAISYALKIPLIHDERLWMYSTPWSSIFEPLGSPCKFGSHSFQLDWTPKLPIIYRNKSCDDCTGENATERILYPLEYGLAVPLDLANKIEHWHGDSFHWWLAQFLQNGLQLNSYMKSKLAQAKQRFNWTSPIVGFHVRRSDKVRETKNAIHHIRVYMAEAKEYFKSLGSVKWPKRIFIASEDAGVVVLARQMYKMPEWNFVGFQIDPMKRRVDTLEETVMDVFLLTETDFVVCGYSSNMCRLVQEMLFIKHKYAFNKLHSLDGIYLYPLKGKSLDRAIVRKSPQ